MKDWMNIFKNISMLTQFGFSLLTPLLLCLGLCWWLSNHFGLGGWIYIPGFFFGLGGGWAVAWKMYQTILRRQEKEKQTKKKGVFFNHHS
ncbi:MAG: AtpZ/AtpI family protein [Lachnospiraceae bacterium]|nr:AtpZ/AtpI family protein [Lachnospiraceae bacterium]